MSPEPRLVLVDTNVLVSATTPARALHRPALEVLEAWPRQGKALCVASQVLREYLVVATRPTAANGLGLSSRSALANVAAFRGRARLLEEDERAAERLFDLVARHRLTGTRIHDAQLIATALRHGVGGLVTASTKDFEALSDEARVGDAASGELEILDLARL